MEQATKILHGLSFASCVVSPKNSLTVTALNQSFVTHLLKLSSNGKVEEQRKVFEDKLRVSAVLKALVFSIQDELDPSRHRVVTLPALIDELTERREAGSSTATQEWCSVALGVGRLVRTGETQLKARLAPHPEDATSWILLLKFAGTNRSQVGSALQMMLDGPEAPARALKAPMLKDSAMSLESIPEESSFISSSMDGSAVSDHSPAETNQLQRLDFDKLIQNTILKAQIGIGQSSVSSEEQEEIKVEENVENLGGNRVGDSGKVTFLTEVELPTQHSGGDSSCQSEPDAAEQDRNSASQPSQTPAEQNEQQNVENSFCVHTASPRHSQERLEMNSMQHGFSDDSADNSMMQLSHRSVPAQPTKRFPLAAQKADEAPEVASQASLEGLEHHDESRIRLVGISKQSIRKKLMAVSRSDRSKKSQFARQTSQKGQESPRPPQLRRSQTIEGYQDQASDHEEQVDVKKEKQKFRLLQRRGNKARNLRIRVFRSVPRSEKKQKGDRSFLYKVIHDLRHPVESLIQAFDVSTGLIDAQLQKVRGLDSVTRELVINQEVQQAVQTFQSLFGFRLRKRGKPPSLFKTLEESPDRQSSPSGAQIGNYNNSQASNSDSQQNSCQQSEASSVNQVVSERSSESQNFQSAIGAQRALLRPSSSGVVRMNKRPLFRSFKLKIQLSEGHLSDDDEIPSVPDEVPLRVEIQKEKVFHSHNFAIDHADHPRALPREAPLGQSHRLGLGQIRDLVLGPLLQDPLLHPEIGRPVGFGMGTKDDFHVMRAVLGQLQQHGAEGKPVATPVKSPQPKSRPLPLDSADDGLQKIEGKPKVFTFNLKGAGPPQALAKGGASPLDPALEGPKLGRVVSEPFKMNNAPAMDLRADNSPESRQGAAAGANSTLREALRKSEMREAVKQLLVERESNIKSIERYVRRQYNLKQFLLQMQGQANMCRTLLQDLLNNAQIQNNVFQLENEFFDMFKILQEAFKINTAQARERQITLRGPVLRYVPHKLYFRNLFGDPRRYIQIIVNLISNAIKFSPQDGVVAVEFNVLETTRVNAETFSSCKDGNVFFPQAQVPFDPKEQQARKQTPSPAQPSNSQEPLEESKEPVRDTPVAKKDLGELDSSGSPYQYEVIRFQMVIKDQGIGISPENQRTLFQNFSKVNESNKMNKSGVGLGLSICFDIVKAAGGFIDIESTLGQGTSFIVNMTAKSRYRKSAMQEAILADRRGDGSVPERDWLPAHDDWVDSDECSISVSDDQASQGDEEKMGGDYNDDYESKEAEEHEDHLADEELARQAIGYRDLSAINEAADESENEFAEDSKRQHVREAQVKQERQSASQELRLQFETQNLGRHNTKKKQKKKEVLRALTANDEGFCLQLQREILLLKFREVVEAHNGQMALDQVVSKPVSYFDLILLDIGMPYMDGNECCRKIIEFVLSEIRKFLETRRKLKLRETKFDSRLNLKVQSEKSHELVDALTEDDVTHSNYDYLSRLFCVPKLYAVTGDTSSEAVAEMKANGFQGIYSVATNDMLGEFFSIKNYSPRLNIELASQNPL